MFRALIPGKNLFALLPKIRKTTLATDNNSASSVQALVNSQLGARPMKEMVQGFIKINQDIQNIPDLSNEQRNDLVKLGTELNNLGYQRDETKIKIELLDIFNRLN